MTFARALFALGLSLSALGCAQETPEPRALPADTAEGEVGLATWYGDALAGRRTASGERFDPREMTAAHRTLPFQTWVSVTRLDTGQSVRVRITDRGPFGDRRRIINLSKEAARELGMLRAGVVRVAIRVLGPAP